MKILITGGAGFIGSAVYRWLLANTGCSIVIVDKMTYAATLDVAAAKTDARTAFEKVDICNGAEVARVLKEHRPDAIMHLAAETHVDRSIDGPWAFMNTNFVGTFVLLEAALAYWLELPPRAREAFRFHHISTDEVYGSLGPTGTFTEDTAYAPNSPYAASKAASDHIVRAWHRTYGLPVVSSNCSNNFGPYQFPEKLIPRVITNALVGKPLPVYGKGTNVRDWLYVDDHAAALYLIVSRGRAGERYNVGGGAERANIEIVRDVCHILDELLPGSPHRPHEKLISFVPDRPGHDLRYAIDDAKLRELGWRPQESFETGLRKTVKWYLENAGWIEKVRTRDTGERIGLATRAATVVNTSGNLGCWASFDRS